MLPLISNALPSSPLPSQSSTAGATLLAATTTDSSTASRQQLPTAVTATPSTASYFAGTTPQTDATTNKPIERVYVPPPTNNYIELPDTQPQQTTQTRSVPVTLGIPLTTQLTAQFISQQPNAAAQQQEAAVSTSSNSDETTSTPSPTKGKQPSFGTARGAVAYSIAAARSDAINAKPEVEAV